MYLVLSVVFPGLVVLFLMYGWVYIVQPGWINNFTNFIEPFVKKDLVALLFYLLLSSVVGTMVNAWATYLVNLKNGIGKLFANIHIPASRIVSTIKPDKYIKYFNEDCLAKFDISYNNGNTEEQDFYFNHVYYSLHAADKKEDVLREQGYYFLYRNLYLSGLIFTIIYITTGIGFLFKSNINQAVFILFWGVVIFSVTLYVFKYLAKLFRKRMIQILFITYYYYNNSNPVNR